MGICKNFWSNLRFFLSPFRNCFLYWDLWNGDVMPTLDEALLCSSRAGADLGRVSGLVWGVLSIGYKPPKGPGVLHLYDSTKLHMNVSVCEGAFSWCYYILIYSGATCKVSWANIRQSDIHYSDLISKSRKSWWKFFGSSRYYYWVCLVLL